MKYKVPSNIVNASRVLLLTIIERLDGSTEAGKMCGISRQAIHNFETEGYVPLKQVYSIAKNLKVSVYALSYPKLMEVFGDQTPDFEIVVKKLNFLTSEDKKKILSIYKKN